ncbi:hypothetical protein XENOCAPTIV_007981 [Xenoophorus captivus]|uniref:Selenocysteine lyase n=1 Tax=Xenoophorus captivus TaxID=1517983 RepID=A0ABV0QMQ5_9TELE
MVGGKAEDIVFTSGGTEENRSTAEHSEGHKNGCAGLPHIITSNVEHDSIRLAAKHLQTVGKAGGEIIFLLGCFSFLCRVCLSTTEINVLPVISIVDVTCVPVSKVTGRVEVEDVIAAVRPNTCLISVMLANNETGVIMVKEKGLKAAWPVLS